RQRRSHVILNTHGEGSITGVVRAGDSGASHRPKVENRSSFHETLLYAFPLGQRTMAGPAHGSVHRPGGSHGPGQGGGPDQDAQRVAVPDRVVPVQRRLGGYSGTRSARGGRSVMNDDTRKLLKVFGVAVTDAEAEAERLAGTAAQLSASAGKEEI